MDSYRCWMMLGQRLLLKLLMVMVHFLEVRFIRLIQVVQDL